MKIIEGIQDLNLSYCVATLGIFDGVHLAHKAIISQLKAISAQNNGQTVVITLWPHPRMVLGQAGLPVQLINTMDEKIEQLEQAGVDYLVILAFNKAMAATSFDIFIKTYLVDYLKVKHLVVGYNHQFGKNREGNFSRLEELANQYKFQLNQFNPYFIGDEKVSSSAIRHMIISGNVKKAAEFLGHPFSIIAKVIKGAQIGRSIGFPTANLHIPDKFKIIPCNGVYAVTVWVSNQKYLGMMNIGTRPTIEDNPYKIVPEVHIFNYSGNLYEQIIKVEFYERIRDEKQFANIDLLKKQLTNDRETISRFFGL